jgi:hypothetical protein
LSADKLWDKADNANINGFIKQLELTNSENDRSYLLLEEEHYEKLKDLINSFFLYVGGKSTLIKELS